MTNSRAWEAGLVAGLSALTGAVLILVEMAPSESDTFVWLGGLLAMVAVGVLWRLKHWPANPWVVILSSVGVVVLGYAIWLWWYLGTHGPHSA